VTFNPLNLALRHHFISYILLAVELSAILIQAIYFIIKPMNSISAGLRNTTPPADQRQHHPNRAFRSLFSLCEFGHIGDCPGDEFVEAASGQGDSIEQPGLFIDADRSKGPIGRLGKDDVPPAGRGRLSPIDKNDVRFSIRRLLLAAYLDLDMIRADD